MTERTIRTMLADDHAVVRMGFRLLLEGTTDIKVVAEAESGEEAVRLFSEAADGIQALALLFWLNPRLGERPPGRR